MDEIYRFYDEEDPDLIEKVTLFTENYKYNSLYDDLDMDFNFEDYDDDYFGFGKNKFNDYEC